MVTRETKKQILIETLAHYLVDDAGGWSIALQVESARKGDDTRPRPAKEWAKLRAASRLHGYPTFDEAVKTLTELLA